jgi:hypothetical protein
MSFQVSICLFSYNFLHNCPFVCQSAANFLVSLRGFCINVTLLQNGQGCGRLLQISIYCVYSSVLLSVLLHFYLILSILVSVCPSWCFFAHLCVSMLCFCGAFVLMLLSFKADKAVADYFKQVPYFFCPYKCPSVCPIARFCPFKCPSVYLYASFCFSVHLCVSLSFLHLCFDVSDL